MNSYPHVDETVAQRTKSVVSGGTSVSNTMLSIDARLDPIHRTRAWSSVVTECSADRLSPEGMVQDNAILYPRMFPVAKPPP